MKRKSIVVFGVLLLGALFFISHLAFADGLIIHSGSTVILNSATFDLNCHDLTVEDGGTMELGNGTVQECDNLVIGDAANFYWDAGTVLYCQDGSGGSSGGAGGGCFIATIGEHQIGNKSN